MASQRVPGPHRNATLENQTGILPTQAAFAPGPVSSDFAAPFKPPVDATELPKTPAVGRLSSGTAVVLVQQLLNAANGKGAPLKPTGRFDERTYQAVIAFQRKNSLIPNGTVDTKTWNALYNATATSGASSLATSSVATWSVARKIEETVGRVPGHLPAELRGQFIALVSIPNLIAALVVFALAQFLGVGEVMDGILLWALGFSATYQLFKGIHTAVFATTDGDIDTAAGEIAGAITTAGILSILSILRFTEGTNGGAATTDNASTAGSAGIEDSVPKASSIEIPKSDSGDEVPNAMGNSSAGALQSKQLASSVEQLLLPGGKPIGTQGSSLDIRKLPGTLSAAQDLFQKLTLGAKDVTPTAYPGKLMELPGGGFVGLRPESVSDGSPAIDINVPGMPIKKIHFDP